METIRRIQPVRGPKKRGGTEDILYFLAHGRWPPVKLRPQIPKQKPMGIVI